MRPPDTEYFWFKLQYKHSTYNSVDHDGYFDTLQSARDKSSKIIEFHRKKIEVIGDIFEQPELTIYKVSGCFQFE